ncbi:MAG: hypothetical protein J0L57_00565 [Burkholderiales bacterium]|nr:hypothetical protein [Burkholderiales bacterium]
MRCGGRGSCVVLTNRCRCAWFGRRGADIVHRAVRANEL